tara:strand:- start:5024 stop:6703 length:1680 start_codon:yes stop_codon:yes gene_type:complete
MEFTYKKNDNNNLFRNLEKSDLTNVSKLQNYIPIYDKFFSLNDTNYNSINLNHNSIKCINSKVNENKYIATITDDSGNDTFSDIFFKYSPLLDPTKYITGKYDMSDNLLELPVYDNKIGYAKIRDPNNSAYVDGFFSYLCSHLLNKYKFTHGINYYGSFLGIKNNFIYDINDEIEYLYDSDFFHKNNNVLFKLDENIHLHLLNTDTRNYKKKINILDDVNDTSLNNYHELDEINNLFIIDDISNNNIITNDSSDVELCYEGTIQRTTSEDSVNTCSSTSSYSDIDNNEQEISDSESSENSSILSDEVMNININEFPVQVIALERCNNTLDSIINENNTSDNELSCIVVQILMMLITYQKVFKFTHNDLHTNNIMYVETDKKYLIYKYKNKIYKIETYGKIFKLIDFGRAIYSFRKNLICSDSYHPKGDAATQYNFEPYYNSDKDIIEPNYSFDLCRLGCSLFDSYVDSIDDVKNIKSDIVNIIIKWCYDDKDRNVLYKNTGVERYPDFKLYKMIARTVHNHKPCVVLENKHFSKYIVVNKSIKRYKNKIIDIDKLEPEY